MLWSSQFRHGLRAFKFLHAYGLSVRFSGLPQECYSRALQCLNSTPWKKSNSLKTINSLALFALEQKRSRHGKRSRGEASCPVLEQWPWGTIHPMGQSITWDTACLPHSGLPYGLGTLGRNRHTQCSLFHEISFGLAMTLRNWRAITNLRLCLRRSWVFRAGE